MEKLRGHLRRGSLGAVMIFALALPGASSASPDRWRSEWPRTDFAKHSVDLDEIRSGGPPKDGIPAIDHPRFERLEHGRAAGWSARLAPSEPVVSFVVERDARAYPLRILIWHEIVNDVVGGVPVLVTYCPLCNSAIVFRRSTASGLLDFGTTGKLRHSDLVMYDRQTESWWQQFSGEAIVGALTGTRLSLLPARLESFARFAKRFGDGLVLVPNDPGLRNYGRNPYVAYDRQGARPFLYDGSMPDGIEPMARVVAVEVEPGDHQAFALSLLRERGEVRQGDVILRWSAGQSSALDAAIVDGGRDVGNVVVQRQMRGGFVDIPYDVTFAFAYHAFHPGSPIHTR
ncbi:Protein of unknown function [Tistlia consotensis]|uniref:DUF3179 domain-containing protein n=2 Tax=Tistlia TaxID=1321364 RepID=A0A1Y6CRR7_9PROT|nr:Protein of unknown function [Tistlia consotensis USBA 355]SNS35019.1 Protein of unknown function [Tistlia consotensis]